MKPYLPDGAGSQCSAAHSRSRTRRVCAAATKAPARTAIATPTESSAAAVASPVSTWSAST